MATLTPPPPLAPVLKAILLQGTPMEVLHQEQEAAGRRRSAALSCSRRCSSSSCCRLLLPVPFTTAHHHQPLVPSLHMIAFVGDVCVCVCLFISTVGSCHHRSLSLITLRISYVYRLVLPWCPRTLKHAGVHRLMNDARTVLAMSFADT
eukprot:scpid56634/ scgid24839/ 